MVDIADGIKILFYLFAESLIDCEDACDSNDDGMNNISDALYIFQYLFISGSPIPAPYPLRGVDLTEDSLTCKR